MQSTSNQLPINPAAPPSELNTETRLRPTPRVGLPEEDRPLRRGRASDDEIISQGIMLFLLSLIVFGIYQLFFAGSDIPTAQSHNKASSEIEETQQGGNTPNPEPIHEPGSSYLMVLSYPWAKVYVDNKHVADAPFQSPLAIEPGTHSVTFEAAGYPLSYYSINAAEGQTIEFKINWEEHQRK